MKTLVLDAMGVIYSARDDVAELLVPFIREHGGTVPTPEINHLYQRTSLGEMSAASFWRSVGLDPALEETYLSAHSLRGGLLDFLAAVSGKVDALWCCSNDVSEWSRKLRRRFALDRYFEGFVISGDVGARKPDPAIYQRLLAELRAPVANVIFVDDLAQNLAAAEKLGLQTVLFAPDSGRVPAEHPRVASFAELLPLLG